MTDNIVSAISGYLTPETIGKLAALTGLDSSLAQRAVAAAVPSMLSGLADVAAKPGGARQLANAVADQPADILSNLASGSAQTAERGTGVLSSLLGGGAFAMLVSAVAKFAGIREGSVRTMMGLLTPVIMGVLGQKQRAGNLDVNGLARMLTGQKDQIAEAMPSGLSRLLESSGLRENAGSTSSPEWRTRDARPCRRCAFPNGQHATGCRRHRDWRIGQELGLLGAAAARAGRSALVHAAERTRVGRAQSHGDRQGRLSHERA